jgi:L-threonylcarbamoyladenylate synthase
MPASELITEVLKIQELASAPQIIARAAAAIQAGQLVAFPTETVYGLGANALDAAAVRRIFAAKGRPAENPVIVHIAEASALAQVAVEVPPIALELAERFWPGPLTLVLRKRPEVPDIVTAGGPTVAVRVPAHPVAQALLRAAQLPIAAPSANASNCLSATRAEHVLKSLGGRIEFILDGGPTQGGLESTVLDVTTTPPRLLRPGLIAPGEIESVIGKITLSASRTTDEQLPGGADQHERQGTQPANVPPRSPGMLSRHYAPRVPLECIGLEDTDRIEALRREHRRIGWLAYGSTPSETCGLFIIEMPREAKAYAAELYAALHTLETAGVERIVVTLPPAGEAWLAIQDRLQRASAPA